MEPIPTAKNAMWSWNLQELPTIAMNRENGPLVPNEPVEVQEFRRITNPFRGILWNTPQVHEAKPKDHNM
jgi:hypothetical protein